MSNEDSIVAVVPITDDNRAELARLALSQYLGMECRHCGKPFDTIDSLHVAVRDLSPTNEFAIAHKSCYDAAFNIKG